MNSISNLYLYSTIKKRIKNNAGSVTVTNLIKCTNSLSLLVLKRLFKPSHRLFNHNKIMLGTGVDSYPVVTPSGVLGRSRAGSSEILMASLMVASRPWPPSPLKAGPKHSGRLIRSFTTTLAFSSTLSPWIQIYQGNGQRVIEMIEWKDKSESANGFFFHFLSHKTLARHYFDSF